MKYSTSKIIKETGNKITITIKLDDECKNGHEVFSITFNEYEKCKNGKLKLIAWGSLNEIINKHFPEFSDFLPLHNSDFNGVPMYPISNGFYHLHNSSKEITVNYLRLIDDEYNQLKFECKTKLDLVFKLGELKIVERWKKEANECIKRLEALTNKTFISNAVKDHFTYETVNFDK